MPQLEASLTLDYQSDVYKDAYSRINAIVIEGEQEAHDNYQKLAELLPGSQEQLLSLAKMESRHKKGFEACGRNLKVTPNMAFAEAVFCRSPPQLSGSCCR
ncbi:long-chain fatty aldehyde decarbonylase [Neosynechococcus sphagnicola]|uniref:long-chain fatty aldehyde decarbonylase n=1 Tax=Neosynechococcus sphagnicola TaxID=1501145 RepID=UPI00308433C6